MAFSIALIIGLLSVSVFSILGGSYSKRVEFYFLGVIILFFVGLSLVTDGYSVDSGHVLSRNESHSGCGSGSNCTSVSEVLFLTTSDVTNVFTNAFGLLFIVIASGLSLTYFRGKRDDREKKMRSVDLDDDF